MWAGSCSWNWISCSSKTSLQVYSWVFGRCLSFHGDCLPSEPAVVAKSSILLDVKPWDDETDMAKLEECVRSIQADGLVWGSCKYGEVSEQGECRPWVRVWVVGFGVTADLWNGGNCNGGTAVLQCLYMIRKGVLVQWLVKIQMQVLKAIGLKLCSPASPCTIPDAAPLPTHITGLERGGSAERSFFNQL